MILNRHFFVADRDILNLSPKAEGVLAPYQVGKGKMPVVIVRYPTETEAKRAWKTFASAYLREGGKEGMVRTENNKWTTARLLRRILVIIFDAKDPNQATGFLKLVSFDPVAIDTIGLKLIQAKRLQYFGEEVVLETLPKHIIAADKKYHLGISDPKSIELIKLGWMEDILI